MCGDSLTLKEEFIEEVLRETICENVIYDEEIIRNKVDRISVFNKYMDIYCKNMIKKVFNF